MAWPTPDPRHRWHGRSPAPSVPGMTRPDRFTDRVAIVTGGSNGLGRACAEDLAAEGAAVVIADLQATPGEAAVDAITQAGGRAVFVELDASSVDDNEAMVSAAIDTYGRIDMLVTAAGISSGDYESGDDEGARKRLQMGVEAAAANPAAALTELAVDDWRRVIDVNLTGTLLAIQATARVMLEREQPGSIVTIASIAARDPLWGSPSYPVSKAGVWMLTKNAAKTLAPLGIRVNSVGPGFIETNMTRVFGEAEDHRAMLMAQTPMGRMGRPEEVANLVLFLLSDEASYMTGELIHPDGGWFTG